MTISTTSSLEIALGNGSTSVFTFGFIAGSASNISVIYTDTSGIQTLLSPSQYTLSLNAPATGALWGIGGTVTYPKTGPAIANGTSLTISRLVPLTQLVSVSNQGQLLLNVIETALDTLCLEIQQVSGRTGQFRGTWATGVAYNFGDIVQDGANGADTLNYYTCIQSDTSGTWATDLSNGYWSLSFNTAAVIGYADAAATSATNAAASATSASASASSASTSASSASTSATAASSSASSASTSAINAASSATGAASSATSASASATSASASATSASSSASTATAQAGIAATQATNAAASATAAAASAVLAGSALTATSTTSNTIGTGTFTFTTQASKNFFAGQYVIAASNANSANYIHGQVSSYSGTTLIITETDNGGSGTHADWNISVSGTQGSGTVNTSGTPVSGNLAKFSGATSITNGDLSGDITTSGTLVTTVAKIAGTTVSGTTGSGNVVFATSPTLVTPILGTPTSGTLTNCTGLPVAGGGTGISTYTAGDILYCSATNVLSKLAKGSDTNVLTLASGLPSWAAPAGSSQVVLLATATASTSATLDFTSKISSSYSSYIVVFNSLLPTTSSGTLQLYVSGDNGSTWTPTLDGQLWSISLASTTAPTYSNNANGVSPADLTAGSLNTGRPLHGVFNFTTGSGANDGQFFWEGTMSTTGGTLYKTFIISGDTANVNAIRIAPSTSTLASGNVYLYGIKNT